MKHLPDGMNEAWLRLELALLEANENGMFGANGPEPALMVGQRSTQ
jgi:hypothetical protein